MSRVGRIVVAVAALVLTLASMAGFLRVFAPKPRPPQPTPYTGYDRAAVTAALTAERVAERVKVLTAFGSRFPGQPGFQRAADYVRQQMEAAELEVCEQTLDVLAPHTLRREILGADGQPLQGVEIYPVFPNHMQPMVTPPEGLSGRLVLLTEQRLREGARFDDCIGVVDAGEPPLSYKFDWERYAQLGLRALIVAPRDGWEATPVERWLTIQQGMVSHDPINYVRLAATPEIYRHLDRQVTLRVQTQWRTVPTRTLIGLLKSARPTHEALVITASYDAFSLLPDRVPGVLAAYELAEMLQLMEGLRAYRADLRRDVIFVATGSRVMGNLAESHLLAAMGPRLDRAAARQRLVARAAENATRQQWVNEALTLFDAPAFGESLAATTAGLARLSPAARRFFDEQLRYVLNTMLLNDSEVMLQARLRFLAGDTNDLAGPSYRSYLAAKREYDRMLTAAGYPLDRLVETRPEIVRTRQVRERLRARLMELAEFHERESRRRQQDLAVHDLFARYGQVVTLAPTLVPSSRRGDGAEAVTFYLGNLVDDKFEGPHFNNLLSAAAQRRAGVRYVSHTKDHANTVGPAVATVPLTVRYWNLFSYPAAAVLQPDRKETYDAFASPVEQPFMWRAETMSAALQWLGEAVLSAAFGNGQFGEPRKVTPHRYFGDVYVAGVGESVLPSYPLAGAVVGVKGAGFRYPGWYMHPLLPTNPYGRYELLDAPTDFTIPGGPFSPNAVGYDVAGRIAYASDEGAAQSIYRSLNIPTWFALQTPVHLVVFRATPVTILDVINPQTLKPYAGLELVRADTLTPFPSFNKFQTTGPVTTFIPPDVRFIVTFKAGSPENELVQVTRAVMLNSQPGETARSLSEVPARGYLAGEHSLLLEVPQQTARSMLALNGQRLAALDQHRMADERTKDFHRKAAELLETAAASPSLQEATLRARDSATYSILNYPVIRGAIFDAVMGILWYLFLLVPFVFFFEKLVFGFTDIRRQLAANTVIFLVVFGLLKLLHPAFGMIRSSLMILLGFIIFLISAGVVLLLSGRFRENLEALRRKRAQVAGAEVNALGVIGTAFALGLNNMHRRKVRTGLTCATLVLITFAMLCFSTLHSDIVDSTTATGKASYAGILVKPPQFRPVSEGELFALRMKYGGRYTVAPRRMYVGYETWTRERLNPSLTISHRGADGELRKVEFTSILQFSEEEPLASQMPLLTTNGWFRPLASATATPTVMIPDAMARKLGLTVEQVQTAPPTVTINGKDFLVGGIFDAERFGQLRDLDGRSLLPFDVTAMTTVRNVGAGRFWEVVAEESDPLMNPANVVLAGIADLGLSVPNGFNRLVSIGVAMPQLNYRDAKAEISQYLEQTGKPTYYGLDGVAYLGKRLRETSLVGLLDLLIPLFIASVTVLNTIRGSVYERRDEIFVYNAVGIAPRYVFFMFMAEALVYSVVGTVLGYLIAQGTGTVLTALDLTGGLSLNFTSKITVYVSLTIILATLASTVFPARSALEIAAPAEEAGWRLPEPEGDRLRFLLPFTFHHRDRVAILAFFHRYLLDHGEGSAGPFFAGPPSVGISERPDPLQPDGCIPEVRSTIWLKPYDLGVSQELVIDLQTDPETREYIACITLERLSGTREAWLRLNHHFVSQIRRHFLHWRAVSAEDREELYQEARALLESTVKPAHV